MVRLVEMTLDKLSSFSGSLQVGGVTQRLVGVAQSTDHQTCQKIEGTCKCKCMPCYIHLYSHNTNIIIMSTTYGMYQHLQAHSHANTGKFRMGLGQS